MTSSLLKEFQEHELENQLEKVYLRSTELFEDNKDANKALQSHLGQITPCIAFYEELIEQEGSREKAFDIYEKWPLCGIEKMAKSMQNLMKSLGLCKLIPNMFNNMIDKLFGTKAGFESRRVCNSKGFLRDMIVCEYVSICENMDILNWHKSSVNRMISVMEICIPN